MLTNPAPPPHAVEPAPLEPGTFVFVGRLTEAKDLGTAIAAVSLVPEVRFVLVGDGPDRADLERLAAISQPPGGLDSGARCRAKTHSGCRRRNGGLLSSAWENLPHSAVEALSVGVPVVSTAVGGVPEVVHDGENGLLVSPGSPTELAAAMRPMLEEPGLRDRLAAAAKPSIEGLSSEAIYGRLELLLAEAAR